MKDYNIKHRKFVNVRSDSNPIDYDHLTSNILKYLEDAGFTITEKMLQYTNNVESLLDEITDWKWINHKMVTKGYIESGDYGR